jgi:hypothetical protein
MRLLSVLPNRVGFCSVMLHSLHPSLCLGLDQQGRGVPIPLSDISLNGILISQLFSGTLNIVAAMLTRGARVWKV